MKIVVDDKIPYISEKLALLADEVVYKDGSAIGADDVRDADALIVRTRTRCDERLLKGSKVRFVATATIGFDHIDTDYLQRAGITWTSCPGCNAGSVAQYVECSLLLLQLQKGLDLQHSVIGIVGCGHVGSKVRTVAERLGLSVLVCDPLLGYDGFVSMDVIERKADIITFHVPLTKTGPYPTWHLADDAFFQRLPRVPYIINSSRGSVVDNQALLSALRDGRVRDAVIDVWEGEPQLNTELLQRVFIGTPHIAGYSADGKVNADNMVIDALCRYFGLKHPGRIEAPSILPRLEEATAADKAPLPSGGVGGGSSPSAGLWGGLSLYNPLDDSAKLKSDPSSFEFLRNHYPLRREFSCTK